MTRTKARPMYVVRDGNGLFFGFNSYIGLFEAFAPITKEDLPEGHFEVFKLVPVKARKRGRKR